MDIYDVEIYRSKVGVKYFELMDTIKGLTLPQKNALTGVLKRMGVEYKVVTHTSKDTDDDGGKFDIFGGFLSDNKTDDKKKDDDDDDFYDDDFFNSFIKGID